MSHKDSIHEEPALGYEAGRFKDFADTTLGQDVWRFLNRPDTILMMRTATALGHPAVEALGKILVSTFGTKITTDRAKQCIGHMVRQVLESQGYRLYRQGVRIRQPNVFSSGSRYEDNDAPR